MWIFLCSRCQLLYSALKVNLDIHESLDQVMEDWLNNPSFMCQLNSVVQMRTGWQQLQYKYCALVYSSKSFLLCLYSYRTNESTRILPRFTYAVERALLARSTRVFASPKVNHRLLVGLTGSITIAVAFLVLILAFRPFPICRDD